MGNIISSKYPPLVPATACETARYMGTWFVIGVKPTYVEKTNSNAVEKYSLVDEKKSYDVDIDFQYNKKEPLTSSMGSVPQKGWILKNRDNSAEWKVSPFWPIKMPYTIIEVDETDYMYTVIGYPSRDYAWIMYRHPVMPDDLYEDLKQRLRDKHQYDLEGLRKVPQVWTKEERERRGLTEKEIPDSMLQNEEQTTKK